MRIRRDKHELLDEDVKLIATVSDALAHPVRIKLLKYIMNQNRIRESVCTKDLVSASGYAQATISQHMKTLLKSGLVEGKKQEKFTYYFVNLGLLIKYVDATKKFSVED